MSERTSHRTTPSRLVCPACGNDVLIEVTTYSPRAGEESRLYCAGTLGCCVWWGVAADGLELLAAEAPTSR